jgi:hypothetical protein
MTSENLLFDRADENLAPGRESVRIVVFGSRDGIQEIVHRLHNAHIRNATDWSPLLPTPEPGVFMRINTHYRVVTG